MRITKFNDKSDITLVMNKARGRVPGDGALTHRPNTAVDPPLRKFVNAHSS